MTNQELIRKADITMSDLTTNGGALQAEEAATFIRKLIRPATLLRKVRTVEMRANTRNVNKIQFATRILQPGTSATALSSGDRSKPTTSQVVLSTDEVIAEVRLPYDVIEDNIERGNIGAQTDVGGAAAGGGLVDTILTLIAERAAVDLEELALKGDTGSGDTYLALTDGYLKEVENNGNTSDAASATISKEIFKAGMKTMPDQYLRDRASLRQFVSFDNETEYRDTVANRATAVGDAALNGMPAVFAFGVPVESVSWMPEDQGLFTNPLNLMMGIQRQVTFEYDKDISARVFIIVVTARVAFQVEEAEAAVWYSNIA